jgi:hypothetical protein
VGAYARFVGRLRAFYEGQSKRGVQFRYGLLAFDLATIAYIVLSSFGPRTAVNEILDVVFGLLILADLISRLLISRNRLRDLLNPVTWADIVAVISFIAPFSSQAAAFCAFSERFGYCTPTGCSRASVVTAAFSATTRKSPSRSRILAFLFS